MNVELTPEEVLMLISGLGAEISEFETPYNRLTEEKALKARLEALITKETE
jgi:hypothetical protein